jgi:hypothetical protein
MKFIKFGFVAIAALFVMSFTVASHAGAFKGKAKSNKFYNCTTSDYISVTDITPFPNVNYSQGGNIPPSGDCYLLGNNALGSEICNGTLRFCCATAGTTCTGGNFITVFLQN